jgi:hypothetical protein
MKPSLFAAVLAAASLSQTARAEESAPPPVLSLSPNAPQAGPVAGGVAPAYHRAKRERNDWRFDFHGMLMVPVRASLGEREVVEPKQQKLTIHAPPVVPDYRGSFNYTGTVPQPYVALQFTYGNPIVTGNISLVSRQPRAGAAFFDPPQNPGIEDAYLDFQLAEIMKNARFSVNVGAFSQRYGTMGEWDEGRYATPLIARTNGIGEAINAGFSFGKLSLVLSQEIQGQADKPWAGISPDFSNDFADARTGAGWVVGEHAGIGWDGMGVLGLHYMTVFSQDDRASQNEQPDGRITILGADLRLTLSRFGHFYLGFVHHNLDYARSIGRIVEILNAEGGVGVRNEYLGPASAATGTLTTVGAQYDLSISRLLYGSRFVGEGPDIVVSVFGMQTGVTSNDKSVDPRDGHSLYDGVTKRKIGIEGTYSLLSWLAVSARMDQVWPDVDYTDTAFAQISPRVLLRSGWNAHDQVALQYTRFIYGSQTIVRSGFPLRDDPFLVPDNDMFALTASLWW